MNYFTPYLINTKKDHYKSNLSPTVYYNVHVSCLQWNEHNDCKLCILSINMPFANRALD